MRLIWFDLIWFDVYSYYELSWIRSLYGGRFSRLFFVCRPKCKMINLCVLPILRCDQMMTGKKGQNNPQKYYANIKVFGCVRFIWFYLFCLTDFDLHICAASRFSINGLAGWHGIRSKNNRFWASQSSIFGWIEFAGVCVCSANGSLFNFICEIFVQFSNQKNLNKTIPKTSSFQFIFYEFPSVVSTSTKYYCVFFLKRSQYNGII